MRYILNRIAKFLSENGRHKNLYTNVNEIEIEKKNPERYRREKQSKER